MVKARSVKELELLRGSGEITSIALKKVLANIKVGITGLELERIAADEIKKLGGDLAFPTVQGYKWASCITVNEEIVHGIPDNVQIKYGDVVSVDLGAVFKGWFTDAAWSVLVGEDNEKKRFLKVGEEALWKGIDQAIVGNRVGDISAVIQQVVEGAGFSVVRSLVGHGVGRALHEEPEVPGFGAAGQGLKLEAGMSLAIEVIYTQGLPEVILDRDGWTIISADGSLGGLYEMTVVVGKSKPEILTDWRSI